VKVFLFRHGEVASGRRKLFLGRTDLALSRQGRRQAEKWKIHFAGGLPERIVSSPLSRARAFAEILAEGSAHPVEICPAFSEIDLGEWDGRPMAEIRRTDASGWRTRGEDMAGFRPPGGESFGDLQRRVVPAFEDLASDAGGDLLVVGHAGVNRVLLCHLLGASLENLFRIGQSFGCLNVIAGGPGRWRIAGMNIPCPA
jgi:probable phosphoglycerate mutase